MVWQLRVTAGSAQISIMVRSGPMPASESAATTLTLAGKPAAASRAVPANTRLAVVQPFDRDVVPHQIGRAGEPVRRLARDHAHRMDGSFGRRRDGVEPEQRAGRHDDLPAMLLGELDQIRPRQQRAGAQHHHPLAGLQHRPADVLDDRGGRAFDREIGVLRQWRRARPADRRSSARRARPAPWRDRAPPRRRASAPACRRRAGAPSARPMAPSPAMATRSARRHPKSAFVRLRRKAHTRPAPARQGRALTGSCRVRPKVRQTPK